MDVDYIQTGNLLGGISGTEQTLQGMASFVRRDAQDLQLRDCAIRIVAECQGHDFRCEIDALFAFVRDRITFRRDPLGQERVQDAKRTLFVFGCGDCDDKCVLLATLLATLGHVSRFKVLGRSPERFAHVYLEVQLSGGAWLPLDPTPEKAAAGWEAVAPSVRVYEIFPPDSTFNPLPLIAFGFFLWWAMK